MYYDIRDTHIPYSQEAYRPPESASRDRPLLIMDDTVNSTPWRCEMWWQRVQDPSVGKELMGQQTVEPGRPLRAQSKAASSFIRPFI